jgi:DNA-binding IclR family transcriptional regulator
VTEAPAGAQPRTQTPPIQSVDRALSLLEAIAADSGASTAAELARRCGLKRGTAWRLLTTLEQHDLIEMDPRSGAYGISIGVAKLATHVQYAGLIRRARPILEALSRESDESTILSIARSMQIVVIDQVSIPRVVFPNWVGLEIELPTSSTGKLLLASLDDDELDLYLSRPLQPRTKTSLTDPAELRRQIERTRQTGVAGTLGEYETGLNSFSAAARDASGRPFAFVTVAGPDHRLPAERLTQLTPALLASADSLAAAISGTGWEPHGR